MKGITIVGVLLIVLGVIALGYEGITYTTREKVLDIGPLKASVDKKKTIPLSPALGALALVGGIVLVVVGAAGEKLDEQGEEGGGVHRLRHVQVRPGVEDAPPVVLARVGRQGHGADAPAARRFETAHALDEADAVLTRHPDVGHEYGRPAPRRLPHRLRHRGGRAHVGAQAGEAHRDRLARVGIVVDHEHREVP